MCTCAAGIRVEVKLLAKIRLDEAREGHRRLFRIQKGCVMGRGPKVLDGGVPLALARQVVERGNNVAMCAKRGM